MGEKIKISIVIPVFNSETTIGKLVESLIKELSNRFNLEIILVNDSSKDNSELVCIDLYNKNKKWPFKNGTIS